ncbi:MULTISPECIES: hypothetical protein [unclassified Kitasatospora]|uniref:hypothetical protein n=1 Tax=unclassified Kitasatospora TaxID=2633591 RepID=UPI0037F310E4
MSTSRSVLRSTSLLLAAGLSIAVLSTTPVQAQPVPSAGASTTAAPAAVPGTNDKGGAGQGSPSFGKGQGADGSSAALQTAGPAISRSTALARAAAWVPLGLNYSWTTYHDGYRQDCSGYVSMAWKLGTPGLDTTSFVPAGVASWIGKGDLKPGDALLNDAAGASGHIVLFDHWTDGGQNSYVGYEFTGTGVHHRVIPYPYFSGYGTYKPVRNNSIVDDAPPANNWQSKPLISAAATGTTDRVNLIGSDGALYSTNGDYSGPGWDNKWFRLDGSGLKALTSVTLGNKVITFALGGTGKVYSKSADYSAGSWSDGWVEVPGGAAGATALTATLIGSTVHLAIVGADGALYSTNGDYSGPGWDNKWFRLDGSGLRGLTSIALGNKMIVFALGETGKVYSKGADYTAGSWSPGWDEVPGGAAGAKGITASVTGSTVHLEIIGSDDALYNTDGDYSGPGWSNIWTRIASNPMKSLTSAVSNNVMHVYGVGTDNRVYSIGADYNAGSWSSWGAVPGDAVSG